LAAHSFGRKDKANARTLYLDRQHRYNSPQLKGEVGDDFFEGLHAAAVAVDHEEGWAGAVDFGVHFEAVDVVVLAGGGLLP
jgi:hypothetical protein